MIAWQGAAQALLFSRCLVRSPLHSLYADTISTKALITHNHPLLPAHHYVEAGRQIQLLLR